MYWFLQSEFTFKGGNGKIIILVRRLKWVVVKDKLLIIRSLVTDCLTKEST